MLFAASEEVVVMMQERSRIVAGLSIQASYESCEGWIAYSRATDQPLRPTLCGIARQAAADDWDCLHGCIEFKTPTRRLRRTGDNLLRLCPRLATVSVGFA